MSADSPKEKSGGLAYDVILAPASKESTPIRPTSPPKPRPLSQEIIEKKLKDAEERRLSMEAAKLESIQKMKERAEEVLKRQEELNNSFAKDSEKKLAEKFQAVEINREEQAKALQEKFQEHANRVADARKRMEDAVVANQQKHAIECQAKMESVKENRDAQLKALQDRLRDHEQHVKEVIETGKREIETMTQAVREKYCQKMEVMYKNREEQFGQIIEKLQEHEKHIQEVREKKQTVAGTENEVDATGDH